MTETSTLLIVDDCEIDREVFRKYLAEDTQTKYEILEAEEAAEGLALCQEIQCDLILLDFRLPDMTGLEFLQQRQQQVGVPPSVIMMTGAGCEALAVQAMKYGAENYLSKQDLEPECLIQAVQEAMRHRRLQSPQSSNPLPEAMAASVLRFRRSLHLKTVVEAAAAEIRHLARCDRVSIVKTSSTTPLTQVQSPLLSQQFPTMAGQRRRGRGRPSKRQPLGLTSIELPIQLPGQDIAWGLLCLESLPESPSLASEERAAFEALVEQLAIAIAQAEEHQRALARIEHLEDVGRSKAEVIDQSAIESRTLLGNVLAAASTLVKHRSQLNYQRQDKLLKQIEDHSREFVRLLEVLSHSIRP